jgi:DNA-directed RNA polymerase omega subunit
MKRDENSLMNPPLEQLIARIPQKYELVLAAAKRAKQIIREQRINPMSVSEEQKHIKPLTIALHDIAAGKVDKEVLLTPDIEFDDYVEENEFGAEFDRLGNLPFTTRPAVDYSSTTTTYSGEEADFSEDDESDLEDEEDDSYIDEDEEPAAP